MEHFEPPPQIATATGPVAYTPIRIFMRELEKLQTARSDSRRALSPKAALHRTSTASISAVWRDLFSHISSNPQTLGLVEVHAGKLEPLEHSKIEAQMRELYNRSWYFPPSKLRAYATRMAEHFSRQYCQNTDIDYYQSQLKQLVPYWFRRSVEEHLSTGFHTAFAVAFKLIIATVGAYRDADREQSLPSLGNSLDKMFVLATTLGSAHMSLLLATDGVLWDSAGAMPAPFIKYINCETGQELAIASSIFDHISARMPKLRATDPEPRYGCPAMMAEGIERPVLRECLNWSRQLAERYYFGLLK